MKEVLVTFVDFIELEHAFNKAGSRISTTGEGHHITQDIMEQARAIYERLIVRYGGFFPALCVFGDRIEQHILQGIFCGIEDEECLAAAAIVRAHADYLCDAWVQGLGPQSVRMLEIIDHLSYRMKSLVAVHLARTLLGRPIEGSLEPPSIAVRICRDQLEQALNTLATS